MKVILTTMLLAAGLSYCSTITILHFLGDSGQLPALIIAFIIGFKSSKIVEYCYGYTAEDELKKLLKK